MATGNNVLQQSGIFIRGYQRGYAAGARDSGRDPVRVFLWSAGIAFATAAFLVVSLIFTVWITYPLWVDRAVALEEVKKKIITKYEAWNAVNHADKNGKRDK